MTIDVIYLVLMVMAVVKGLRKGLIIAVFSVIALITGLAAALKLSVVVAGFLSDTTTIGARWLPVISFIIVFLMVALLVRWVAGLLEAAIDAVWLGWVNKLGGILLYMALYTIIFSVLLFFATQVRLVSADTVSRSKTYGWIEPLGPAVINGFGKMIPVFKNMFTELTSFFARLSA